MAEFAIRLATKDYGRMIPARKYRCEYRAGDAVHCRVNNFEWGRRVDYRQTNGAEWSGNYGILRVQGLKPADGRKFTTSNDRGIAAFFADDEFYAPDEEDRRHVKIRRVRYRLDLSAHPDLLVPPHYEATNNPTWISLL